MCTCGHITKKEIGAYSTRLVKKKKVKYTSEDGGRRSYIGTVGWWWRRKMCLSKMPNVLYVVFI